MSPWATAQILAGGLGALVGALNLAVVIRTLRALPLLSEQPGEVEGDWPSLSVLIPACDEADTLPATLAALLALRYPRLEVVVVDDRSTDETPAVLTARAREDARLRPVRISALPPGWLGKVHALHVGMEAARTDWVLLMDADVELMPGTLRRAVAYAEAHGLSLLSAHPEIRSGGLLVDAVFNGVALGLGAARYWEAADPGKETAISVGAFILVRREHFLQTEGFPWLKMEVADDMALSLLLKRAGRRVGLLNGRGQIVLTWYRSFGEMQHRMQKNWYAIMGRCSVARSLALAGGVLLLSLLPLTQLVDLGAPLPARVALGGAGALGLVAATGLWARQTGRPMLTAAVPWLGHGLIAWMLVRSAIIGARVGGIEWRGQRYTAAEINAGRRVWF